ncbi:putative p-loop containing nucleoside triphosphate hydrolase [Erysiphe necator]|uniref:Putative p-loop containing nucleoside triphosphate hydrolase n=1 Tax=Uncinula necator TaxID=52586 RepID=A0A0B1P815_UNCNE|nr:putative p-loop containing nucleoside triphosphate hydrolase [Erysiphe necator]
MKSWEAGRIELGREFARICELIDKNISEEINSSTTIPVDRDELQQLRKNSSKVEKLIENNAHLIDELERCKAAAARVDLLEKENKALATEHTHILSKLECIKEPKINLNISPLQTDIVTEGRIDVKEYQRLARKFIVISENCNQLKCAWAKMEKKLREQKRKSREWALRLENRDNIIKRKDQKMKRLEQEFIELKQRLGTDEKVGDCVAKNSSNSISQSDEDFENKTSGNIIDYSIFNQKPCFQSFENPNSLDYDISVPLDKSADKITTENHDAYKLQEREGYAVDKNYGTHYSENQLKLQTALKRKKDTENDDNLSGQKNDEIIRSPFGTQGFQYLRESIDLDDIGEKSITPKKPHSDIRFIGKSKNSKNSVILKYPIAEEVGVYESCRNVGCYQNQDRNSNTLLEKPCLSDTEAKCMSPVISQARGSGFNDLLEQETAKTLSEPRSSIFELRACNQVNIPSNLPFSSPKLSAGDRKSHLELPLCRSSRSKMVKFQQKNLRAQPIEKLDVRDFKINPDYNQGYNYAFSEVVRGNARKKGLQGCLKPCCAPKYRALAEISRDPSKNLSISQQESDRLMLEEFLGDNAYKLQDMSEMDMKELLIQAKTRDLANKHGIHRHAYQNPETPVGIWDADFPTTQEVLEDEKIIIERKRKTVLERYAEAMRPGGAYKFRDE